jgi:hypothetical protein
MFSSGHGGLAHRVIQAQRTGSAVGCQWLEIIREVAGSHAALDGWDRAGEVAA